MHGTEVLLESFVVIWGVHRAVDQAVISQKANVAVYSVSMSLMKRRNRIEPKTDPCVIPDSTSAGSESGFTIHDDFLCLDR